MPALAIWTDLRVKLAMPAPGIWNVFATSHTARIARFGARSKAAPRRSRHLTEYTGDKRTPVSRIFIEKACYHRHCFARRHQLTEMFRVQSNPRTEGPRQSHVEGSVQSLDCSLCGTGRPMLKIEQA